MFQGSYCRHHDGIRAKSCSKNASAIVSQGLESLRKNYKALVEADRKRVRAPGFHDKVWEVASRTIDNAYGFAAWVTSPVGKLLTAVGLGATNGGSVGKWLHSIRVKQEGE
jgi:hypothetical protein